MAVRVVQRQSFQLIAAIIALFLLNLYFVGETTKEDFVRERIKSQIAAINTKPITSTEHHQEAINGFQKTRCTADGIILSCARDSDDVYFPFSFLKKRFDLSGRQNDYLFEWITSYARTKIPDFKAYNYTSEFGHFVSYSVETRDRVRCISPKTEVPMSTQWDTTPYYYPIQIAQFGLQHYSKLLSANGSLLSEFVLGKEHRDWQGSASTVHESSVRTYFKDEESGVEYVNISSGAQLTNAGVYVYLKNDPAFHVVNFLWKPDVNASFTFLLKVYDTSSLILLNYVQSDDSRCVFPDGVAIGNSQTSFTFSLGENDGEWHNVTRDLLVDAARAMNSLNSSRKSANVIFHPGDLKYVSVGFRGESTLLQRIYQRNQAHRQNFLTAARWALENQDERGGWSVPVERTIADHRLVLASGWYSAMAQGHMLSLLSRAYYITNDIQYIKSAIKALTFFNLSVADGGVRNKFLGYIPWYEEYPTTPGSFVLNGFMYSLIGLYDLSSVDILAAPEEILKGINLSAQLFHEGIRSLLNVLPLFDTGSGSIYDLRHVALATEPNLARWDYHAVHVYLLHWLAIITGEDQLHTTAQRWSAYAKGYRARHN